MICTKCCHEMKKTKSHRGEAWGQIFEAEASYVCPNCEYEFTLSYGAIFVENEGNYGEEDDYE